MFKPTKKEWAELAASFVAAGALIGATLYFQPKKQQDDVAQLEKTASRVPDRAPIPR